MGVARALRFPPVACPGHMPANPASLGSQLDSETHRENAVGGQQPGLWLIKASVEGVTWLSL